MEPIAIVGIGCRFPGGVSSPSGYWDLLCRGIDAIRDVPSDRWDVRRFYDPDPEKPGKMYVKQGGFLEEPIDQFDPLFFGMSPREAEVLDPQQRLLLMVAWEAIEDAGLRIERLEGSNTGVFVGGFCLDNMVVRLGLLNQFDIGSHTATSSTMAMLANRVSYAFDLRGPSLTVDTACSSSLTATHLACCGLWNGECSIALAGGVSIMLDPAYPIAMSKGGFLSPLCRCTTFDKRAAGYARGEGAGTVVLKRLADAKRDGDDIYALIRSSGVNQDGHTAGIALPNTHAQESLIRDVYRKAGVRPDQISYVEAHGTGTQAGDPAEARALDAVLREGRNGQRCPVGSVKTNMGHLEAAAGIAGLIKTALCLKHQQVPPSLHFETANPEIPFDDLCIRVPTRIEPLSRAPESATLAGVNSFGYGGTNAHVLLQSWEAEQIGVSDKAVIDSTWKTKRAFVVPVSAKHPAALAELARQYANCLEAAHDHDSTSLPDFVHTLVHRRSHHRHRLAVIAESREQLVDSLRSHGENEEVCNSIVGQTAAESPKIMFVYNGMGPHWYAMGRELMRTERVYREAVESCDAHFRRIAGMSIVDELNADEEESRVNRTDIAQATGFALQVGLTRLLESWGVHPDGALGHSVGEVPVAYISGALTLEEAVLVSHHRGRLQQTRAGLGTMLAVGLAGDEAEALVEGWAGRVEVAAVNASSSVTLAGDPEALEEIGGLLTENEVFNKLLRVEVAFHSHHMDPLADELAAALSQLAPKYPHLPVYSTVTGAVAAEGDFGASYWWNNVRRPVLLARAVQSAIDDGFNTFVEIGPHPVLVNSLREILREAKRPDQVVPTLIRKQPERPRMMESLGQLWCLGCGIDWDAVAPTRGRFRRLPTYPWQTERYWSESKASHRHRVGSEGTSSFVSDRRDEPTPTWEVELNRYYFPYLEDHKIEGTIVFPGAAYVEAALSAAHALGTNGGVVVTDIEFEEMLVIEPRQVQKLQTRFDPDAGGEFGVYARTVNDDEKWRRHARGRIVRNLGAEDAPTVNLPMLLNRIDRGVNVDDLYDRLSGRGLNYGPAFRSIRHLWTGEAECLAEIKLADGLPASDDTHQLAPPLLDGAFQAFLVLLGGDRQVNRPFDPVSIDRVTCYCPAGNEVYAHVRVLKETSTSVEGSIALISPDGRVYAELTGVVCQAIGHGQTDANVPDDWFYATSWELDESLPSWGDDRATGERHGTWLVVGDSREASAVVSELQRRGRQFVTETHDNACSYSGGYVDLITESFDVNEIRRRLAEYPEPLTHVVFAPAFRERELARVTSLQDVCDPCVSLVELVQAIPDPQRSQRVCLAVVTRGAHTVVAGEGGCPAASAVWGLARVVRSENADLAATIIDLDPEGDPAEDAHFVVAELAHIDGEAEIAFRNGKRYVHRLGRRSLEQSEQGRAAECVKTNETCVRVELGKPGNMESLYYTTTAIRKPGPNEVCVQVHSAPLNFKDLLKVLGRLSKRALQETFFEDALGMECSGTVVAAGSKVDRVEVGDDVIIAAPDGCFSSYITTDSPYVIRKPKSLSFEGAAVTIPFATAIYGLVHLARLDESERVLIHNATGGVGLAAVQVAQRIGAEIFATAGTPEKRRYLRELGVPHVFNSRTLEFADQIREVTAGYGVDVVLNAMAGSALTESFNLLAPYGRFIEIGKRDIVGNAGLPMRAFNRGLMFAAIDIDRMLNERQSTCQQLLREFSAGCDAGHYRELPTRVFPAAQVVDSFRFMAQSRHTGKVVLRFDEEEVEIADNAGIRHDGTYVVTGGLSGFGLKVAEWLVESGAGGVVLLSRRGASSDESKEAISRMQDCGAQVLAAAVDVTDEKQLRQVLDEVRRSLPPLRGVFHAAMVLDDCFLGDVGRQSIEKVLAPKTWGAVLLHRLTFDDPLDVFVSFSSISALVGNPGQGAYAAANAFLDSLAHARRAMGLPATTINWGVFGQTGVVARNEDVGRLLASSGIQSFSNSQAIAAMGKALANGMTQVGIFDVDWSQWKAANAKAAGSSFYKDVLKSLAGKTDQTRMAVVREILRHENDAQQEAAVDLVRREIAKILRLSSEKVDPAESLTNLGVDSMMTAELTVRLQDEFGLELTVAELMKGPSINQLAERLRTDLSHFIVANADLLIDQLEEVSEEEVDRMYDVLAAATNP